MTDEVRVGICRTCPSMISERLIPWASALLSFAVWAISVAKSIQVIAIVRSFTVDVWNTTINERRHETHALYNQRLDVEVQVLSINIAKPTALISCAASVIDLRHKKTICLRPCYPKGENVRHSHVIKTLKKDIHWGIFFHFELVRLIFLILRLFHYVKLHHAAKCETNFKLVIIAY